MSEKVFIEDYTTRQVREFTNGKHTGMLSRWRFEQLVKAGRLVRCGPVCRGVDTIWEPSGPEPRSRARPVVSLRYFNNGRQSNAG